MITKKDLIVGQYVKCIYGKYVEFIESVNSQYAYTNLKHRIYPKDYNDYITLSNEEVKALNVHYLNDELQDLLSNLQYFKEEVCNLSNLPYFTINTEELEEDWKKDIDAIKQALDRLELLEKVIKILKEKANIRLHILTNTDGSKIYEIEFIFTYYSTIHEITQQEYDLLKEVLENGGN